MKAEDGNMASFTVHAEEDMIPRGAAEHSIHSGTCGELDRLPLCQRRERGDHVLSQLLCSPGLILLPRCIFRA